MMSIDLRLTLFALIPLPFVSIAVRFFGTAIHRRFERIQAQLSDLSAVAQEALSGVRVVRAYRQERAEIARFERANREYLERNRRLIGLQGFFYPSMSFFLGLGALLVLWLGGREVVQGRMSVGQFVAFNSYLTMLAWPMIAFGWVTNMLQRGMASWKRMLEVFDADPAVITYAPAGRPVIQTIAKGGIEIRGLTFAFDGQPVLWHQDGSFWPLKPMEVISLWLSLDEVTPENGCMRVIPGTQAEIDYLRTQAMITPNTATPANITKKFKDLAVNSRFYMATDTEQHFLKIKTSQTAAKTVITGEVLGPIPADSLVVPAKTGKNKSAKRR